MSSIHCPSCGGKTSVSETRTRETLRRRRKCNNCGTVFHTVEITEDEHRRYVALWKEAERVVKEVFK